MSAAAGREVKIFELHDTQFVALGGGRLAQPQLLRIRPRNVPDPHIPILENHVIRSFFGSSDLFGSQCGRGKVDGAIIVRHVKRKSRNLIKLDECCRENVLPGVLLHMFAPAVRIDGAVHVRSRSRQLRWRIQIVQHATIFCIRNFGYAQPPNSFKGKPSRIVNLAAAGGIKCRFSQNHGRTRLIRRGREHFFDHRIKFVQR